MILTLLQARVSSTRLPGKVLKPILGRPMLAYQMDRLQRVRHSDKLVVATSRHSDDDPIETLCGQMKITCFRGALDDVLDRFYQAAKRHTPSHIVRSTGDCPLIDPAFVDRTIEYHLSGGFDYSSNNLEPTFPDGLDSEVFSYRCLEEAWKEARLPSQREHVTPFIYQHPERYKIGTFKNPVDLSAMRWTVDEPADFELIKSIYEALYPKNPEFNMGDILDLLDAKPELKTLNKNFLRNEGYQASLKRDAQAFPSKGSL